ncbi:MAG: AI-2E family transporter, partial [Actinobacteria bacterium]|nr:AI-2E family transporter [Actinomycetota bacterium]
MDITRIPPWFIKGVWYVIFAVSLSICLWYVASRLTDLMITVAICFFLAFAIEPTVNRLSARGWKRSRAT